MRGRGWRAPAVVGSGRVPADTFASRNGLWNHIPGIPRTGIEACGAPERAGDPCDSLVDLTRAEDLLGYLPVVALRGGARRTVGGPGGSPRPDMGTAS